MELQIVRFTSELEQAWDEFVLQKAKNGTFLHTRSFFNHNRLNAEDDYSLLFYKKQKLLAVFPANLYQKEGQKILHSYLRSTYGGILFSNETSVAELEQVIKLILNQARVEQITEIIIRPTFSIYHQALSQELDYLLWKTGFSVRSRELELAIELNSETEDLYADSTNRSIKKALKSGISTQESEKISDYWVMLEKNLLERYGKQPVHTVEEILYMRELVGSDKLRLFTATINDNIIAGILTFVANNRVLHAQYIASDNEFQELRPLNAVIDFIAKKAYQLNFKYFNLGMVSEPGGHELNEGLCRFKEGFGARGVLRETMHIRLNAEQL